MKNAITYKNRNGYLYPLLALPETEEAPIGKYGWMYLDYLKKHRRGTYTSLLTSGNLGEELSKFLPPAEAGGGCSRKTGPLPVKGIRFPAHPQW